MNRALIPALLTAVLTVLPACGESTAAAPTTAPADNTTPLGKIDADAAFAGYDTLLKEHVDADGWVDYAALVENRGALDAYVASLADPAAVFTDKLPHPDTRLTRLINAYNAFTLQLIVDHYDGGKLESIMDLHGGKPWDQKVWNLGGETVSLNQLEHEIIRREFDEPRIHWALVCAAYSCPPLRSEAYVPEQLDEQLAEQEAYVLNFDHPRFTQRLRGSVGVSRLFDWYGQDFGDDWRAYVTERLPIDSDTEFTFLDYDWRLNDVTNRPD